jgi:hypothetical protein
MGSNATVPRRPDGHRCVGSVGLIRFLQIDHFSGQPLITRAEAIRRLRLFNLKAARLERSKFRAWYLDQDRERGHSRRLVGDVWHIQWAWPEDEEVVDAYLLTLRMFVQEDDVISVHRLPELYYALGIPPELLDKLTFARKRWLRFLRTYSTLVSGKRRYTNEQVLDLVLYGDRAHLDLELRDRYESWYSNAGSRAILETRLAEILDFVHVGISVLRDFHQEVLAIVDSTTPSSGQDGTDGFSLGARA